MRRNNKMSDLSVGQGHGGGVRIAQRRPGRVPGADGPDWAVSTPGSSPEPLVPQATEPPDRQEAADRLFEVLLDLLGAGNAIDLRIARIAAWIRCQDPADCGYASHGAIFREHIGWGDSWLRALVRLVQSDLPLIQSAVCRGRLPPSVAVRAPGLVEPSEQSAWLQGALEGDLHRLPRPQRRRAAASPEVVRTVQLDQAELADIHRARQLARLVAGQPLSDPAADRFVLDCWRRGVDGAQLVAAARLDPPVPPERTPSSWCGLPDPATPILGPWSPPRDLPHALRLLERVQVARGSRVVLVGQAFYELASRALHHELGFDTLAQLARDGLGVPVRQLERHRRLALDLECLPPLAQAIDAGLDLARALLVASIACEDTVSDWLHVARNTGMAELQRAVKLAGRPGPRSVEPAVLGQYRRAIALAGQVVEAQPAGEAQPADATDTGDPLRVFVSLNAAWAPPTVPRYGCVHADLPTAARWFLQEVKIEPQRGFGKVKERDHHTCRNPECGRRSLRVQAHHLVFRSEGGSDDLCNGITLCPVCHLRLVHTGRISVTRVGRALVWRYPGRVVVAL
jgi:hypothetical protein